MHTIGCTFLALLIGNALHSQDSLRVQIHGLVVSAETEAPVFEALVEWYDASGKRQAITQTNSEGAYALFVRTTGQVELRVQENGYVNYSDTVEVHPGESAHEHVIRLVPK